MMSQGLTGGDYYKPIRDISIEGGKGFLDRSGMKGYPVSSDDGTYDYFHKYPRTLAR
jgi:hypothetical protein